ncbi:UPF0481 protein At3g47200-like [Fagus crenata]
MAVNGADSVAINIEGLASSIEKDMASNDLVMSPKCCIFKTPTILYMHNEKAYVPEAFSIGPFHHGHPNLADTEKIKKKYLHGLISLSPSPKTKLRDLIKSVNEVQIEARECYSKPIGYSPDEFVEILVIDGCFIIELFRKVVEEVLEDNDPVSTRPCMLQFLYHDLILLENQVPWMVLERLYNLTMDSNEIDSEHPEGLIKLATKYFEKTLTMFTPLPPLPQTIKDCKHIPDLIIKWTVSLIDQVEQGPNQISSRGEEGWRHMPSATSLVEAGIKFRRVESKSILDIEFKDARFTSYAILIDNLINTTKDVDILCENKIIDNWLNSQDAVPFFNKLYHNTFGNKYYYQSLSMDVNTYCQRRWPRWRTALVRNYLHTPWAIFSAMAAIILLILSLLQTVYSMKK